MGAGAEVVFEGGVEDGAFAPEADYDAVAVVVIEDFVWGVVDLLGRMEGRRGG